RRTPDFSRFNTYSHHRPRAPNTPAPAFHVKVENLASSSESSPYECEMDSQKNSARSSVSSAPQPEKRYTFRDGILVEVSDLDLPPRKGAPPVIRKRRISESPEVVVPSSRSRDSWSAERDTEPTTSQEAHHVHFADPDPESATPSPTPSACYEVEISPGDSSQAVPQEVVSSVSHDTPRPKRISAPRLRDDVDHGGVDWDVPEMSLRPRVVPRRDHPYERATPVYRPVSPTTKCLALNSMAQRLEKSAERSYSARAAGKSENGTRAGYKLVPTSREATHVHPFDAEMMAEGKDVTLMNDVEEGSSEPDPDCYFHQCSSSHLCGGTMNFLYGFVLTNKEIFRKLQSLNLPKARQKAAPSESLQHELNGEEVYQ
ncbi:unnamed protein product, partial [Cylicostephanus goldi]